MTKTYLFRNTQVLNCKSCGTEQRILMKGLLKRRRTRREAGNSCRKALVRKFKRKFCGFRRPKRHHQGIRGGGEKEPVESTDMPPLQLLMWWFFAFSAFQLYELLRSLALTSPYPLCTCERKHSNLIPAPEIAQSRTQRLSEFNPLMWQHN